MSASPHLREFLREVMGSDSLHPYLSDLGVAVNIMRPPESSHPSPPPPPPPPPSAASGSQSVTATDTQPAPDTHPNPMHETQNPNRTALGFHFDSIDSSARASLYDTSAAGTINQPRGATGVIGIQDCEEGGERVIFPSIDRTCVDAVRCVTEQYDPLAAHSTIKAHTPDVVTDPTAGFLYLFNGGDVLHGVSGVRKGVRIAAVFLFQEDRAPEVSLDSAASCKYFYDDVTVSEAETETATREKEEKEKEKSDEISIKNVSQSEGQKHDTSPGDVKQEAVKERNNDYAHGQYDSVYTQSTPELYDQWALDGYDTTVAATSVAVHSVYEVITQTLLRMPTDLLSSPMLILDAGCGTGRVAEICREKQHLPCSLERLEDALFDGIDYSPGMLTVCGNKSKLYRYLIQADLKQALPSPATVLSSDHAGSGGEVLNLFQDGEYDGVVSSGTFLQGHVGPEALPELCRLLCPGGFLVFSVRPGFFVETRDEWFSALEAHGMIDVEVTLLPYTLDGLDAPIVSCFKAVAEVTSL